MIKTLRAQQWWLYKSTHCCKWWLESQGIYISHISLVFPYKNTIDESFPPIFKRTPSFLEAFVVLAFLRRWPVPPKSFSWMGWRFEIVFTYTHIYIYRYTHTHTFFGGISVYNIWIIIICVTYQNLTINHIIHYYYIINLSIYLCFIYT